jgi:hypothetical protein
MMAFAFIGGSTVSSKAFSADVEPTTIASGAVILADVHPYRHCHNLSKRTYCHKADRLPQNWPPNTDTPHRGGPEVNGDKECPLGSDRCLRDPARSKGWLSDALGRSRVQGARCTLAEL